MNSKRKNRSISARPPKSRGIERNVPTEGVYSNSHFMHSVTSLIGNVVKVHKSTGVIFEGIFRTFSAQFEVVLELAHKVEPSNPMHIAIDTLVDKIIFKPQDISELEVIDADMEYATGDSFQTDTAISKFNGQLTEKELEPWEGPESNVDEFDLDGATSNGWDVNEMFRQNEQMYGVTSDFDQGLSGYTTPLQNKHTKDYKDAEAKAAKIANDIENNPGYKARINLENDDEEEKFAAVVRPASTDNRDRTDHNSMAKPPYMSPPFPHHSPLPHVHIGSKERLNGINESPKPQRTPITSRRARSFANSERFRFNHNSTLNAPPTTKASESTSTAHVERLRFNQTSTLNSSPASSPTDVISTTHAGDSKISNTHYNNYPPDNKLPPPEHHHQRKPPASIIQHPVPTSLNIPRATTRGREDLISELKQFKNNFVLNESQTEDKKSPKTPIIAEPEHLPVTPITSSSLNVEAPVEVMSPHPSETITESPDSKAVKSKLNPDAKEFVPNDKPFAPRTVNTPTQSRPHTPQTPGYGGSVSSMPTMVMPMYVVTTSQPPYTQQPTRPNRYLKVHMGMSQPSQMQVAAATGQPLLAPAPMHAHFTVPYSPQAHISPQPYPQMVRMVTQQSGGMVPPVLTAVNYPSNGSQQTQMQFMCPGGFGPRPHHPPHVYPQNTISSPQPNNGLMANAPTGNPAGAGGVPNSSGGPPPHMYPPSPANSYSQQPPGAPRPPNPRHTYPVLCPILPAPPSHTVSHTPHHMIGTPAAQSSVQANLHHHPQHSSSVGYQ